MAIYALFSNISARSGLAAPFATQWSNINSISWGTARPFTAATGAFSGVAQLNNIQLNKLVDGASTALLKNELSGTVLSYVNIAIADATSKTLIAFKLASVFITATQFGADAGGSANEVISLAYRQIAMAVLTAGTIDTASWDISLAASWAFPSTTFTLDPTYGIKIA